MLKATIKLNLISEVLKLAEIAQSTESDVMLKHGSYVIDATSILGIMSLNLSERVEIQIVEKKPDEALSILKKIQDEGFDLKITEE